MPEDNYLECMNAIAETMKGTNWKGEWYGKRGFFHIFYLWIKNYVPLSESFCEVLLYFKGYIQ